MVREDPVQTRHTLLQRMKDLNDQASWEEFDRLYRKLIYGTALKAGLLEEEAEDVVQETFLSVAKNLNSFRIGKEHGSFKGFLLQTTRWRIADQLRKRLPVAPAMNSSQDSSRTSTAERVPDPASLDLDSVWENDWRQTLADAGLAILRGQVDPEEYQIFDLHILKELPALEVARRMNVKLAKVYFTKYKVARMLKKEIKKLEQAAAGVTPNMSRNS